MGSITRSFANNITTSGVLLPASLNNNSISNVTAYNAAVATGNMVLISSQTASASTSLSFTLSSDYKEFQFYFINVHNNTDANSFDFNFSTDNGSNYNVTKTSTVFLGYHVESGAFEGLGYRTDGDLAQSTAVQPLLSGSGMGSDSDQCLSGYMSVFNPSSTTYVKHFIASTSATSDSDLILNTFIAGYANTTSALTNIRFLPSSGNFDGTILMYGIK
jgi:hypothetical protein